MICRVCGNETPDELETCLSCGAVLRETVAQNAAAGAYGTMAAGGSTPNWQYQNSQNRDYEAETRRLAAERQARLAESRQNSISVKQKSHTAREVMIVLGVLFALFIFFVVGYNTLHRYDGVYESTDITEKVKQYAREQGYGFATQDFKFDVYLTVNGKMVSFRMDGFADGKSYNYSDGMNYTFVIQDGKLYGETKTSLIEVGVFDTKKRMITLDIIALMEGARGYESDSVINEAQELYRTLGAEKIELYRKR